MVEAEQGYRDPLHPCLLQRHTMGARPGQPRGGHRPAGHAGDHARGGRADLREADSGGGGTHPGPRHRTRGALQRAGVAPGVRWFRQAAKHHMARESRWPALHPLDPEQGRYSAGGGDPMTRQELRVQGEATLKDIFGSAAQTRGLANLLVEPVYGGVWNRPGLARADRMVCTLAALATGPRLKALRRHLAAGLDLGLGPEAIREILVQAALYAGFSAAEEALAVAAEVVAGGRRT